MNRKQMLNAVCQSIAKVGVAVYAPGEDLPALGVSFAIVDSFAGGDTGDLGGTAFSGQPYMVRVDVAAVGRDREADVVEAIRKTAGTNIVREGFGGAGSAVMVGL